MINKATLNHVLLVENNPTEAQRIQSLFEGSSACRSYALRCVSQLEEALDCIKNETVDLVLLDLTLPGCGELDALNRLRDAVSHLPVIALSDEDDDLALRVVQEGAQDCLVKRTLTYELLHRAMRYAMEREGAEFALAQERTFLNEMLKSGAELIYFKDAEGRFLRISSALASSLGLESPDDAIGKTDFDFLSKEKAEANHTDEARVIKTGQPVIDRIESSRRQDGSNVWLLTSRRPLRNRYGRIVGVFGESRDITMLHEMEESLSRERHLLRRVIDNVPDFISPTDAAAQAPAALPAMKAEVPAEQEGETTGVVKLSSDITKQKRSHQQLLAANAELLNTRTDLMQALDVLRAYQLELIETEKMKLVGRLAAGVAHEVKNPLAIILMGTDYLRGGELLDDPNVPELLFEMNEAVRRANTVIHKLLDFSAPKQLHFEPANINDVLRHALLLVRESVEEKAITIVDELSLGLPAVRLDPTKMEQSFVNILNNACQAMSKGGILTVKTSTRQVTGVGENICNADAFRLGDQVLITEIQDNGSGLPPDAAGKVFEPFFTTKPTGQGTGLGLTVTKTIIDLHRGTIDIRNRPEGGASVTIVLRAEPENA